LTTYYILLLLSGLNSFNHRIVIYGVLFCCLEFMRNLYTIRDIIDPLDLGTVKCVLKWGKYLVQLNMGYILFKLMYELQNISTVILVLHFLLDDLKKPIPNRKSKGINIPKLFDFINPILLYSFAATLHNDFADLSLVFLIMFCANLIITAELRQLLLLNENDLFGWHEVLENGKKEWLWEKKYALKMIVMACCLCLVLQNFLLIFDSVKTEAGLAIIHTLILGVSAHVFYQQKNTTMF
jgi:hypothetical protein